MTFQIDVGSLLSAGVVLGLAVLIVRNNNYIDKKIDTHKQNTDKKIANGIAELDVKKVEVAVCKIVSKQYEKDISELKATTACLPKIKSNLDLLLVKNGLKVKE